MKPIWIVGNGPSLTIPQLEAIQDTTSFGTNLISKIYNKTKWRPTYYVAVSSAYTNLAYRPWIIKGIKESPVVIIDKKIVDDLGMDTQDRTKWIVLPNVQKGCLFWSYDMERIACAWGFSHLISFNYLSNMAPGAEVRLLGFDLGYKPPTDKDHSHLIDDYWDIKYMKLRTKKDPTFYERMNRDHLRTHELIKRTAFLRICNASPHSNLLIYPKVKPPAKAGGLRL